MQYNFEERLRDVKNRLMEMEGVSGVGVGEYEGSLHVVIMLKSDDERLRAKIEDLMGDIPYKIVISGGFRPLKR